MSTISDSTPEKVKVIVGELNVSYTSLEDIREQISDIQAKNPRLTGFFTAMEESEYGDSGYSLLIYAQRDETPEEILTREAARASADLELKKSQERQLDELARRLGRTVV
jgi:hypothetical protein